MFLYFYNYQKQLWSLYLFTSCMYSLNLYVHLNFKTILSQVTFRNVVHTIYTHEKKNGTNNHFILNRYAMQPNHLYHFRRDARGRALHFRVHTPRPQCKIHQSMVESIHIQPMWLHVYRRYLWPVRVLPPSICRKLPEVSPCSKRPSSSLSRSAGHDWDVSKVQGRCRILFKASGRSAVFTIYNGIEAGGWEETGMGFPSD